MGAVAWRYGVLILVLMELDSEAKEGELEEDLKVS